MIDAVISKHVKFEAADPIRASHVAACLCASFWWVSISGMFGGEVFL
jgi:hypothetical protein